SADSYTYNGRAFDVAAKAREVLDGLEARAELVVAGTPQWQEEFCDTVAELVLERHAFDTPGLIMFTSGTTGLPKAIVQSALGMLLQHIKEHVLHGDVSPGELNFWVSSTGSMNYCMAPLVLSAVSTTDHQHR